VVPGRQSAFGAAVVVTASPGDERSECGEVQRARMTQGPRERPAALGGVQTGLDGMQGRTTADRSAVGIGGCGHKTADLGHDHS
jgi:hypothetical protein